MRCEQDHWLTSPVCAMFLIEVIVRGALVGLPAKYNSRYLGLRVAPQAWRIGRVLLQLLAR